MLHPSLQLVVITCMDSRLIPEQLLGLGIGDAVRVMVPVQLKKGTPIYIGSEQPLWQSMCISG